MWPALALAGIGAVLMISGSMVLVHRVDGMFEPSPLETVEQLALACVAVGAGFVIGALAYTYIHPLV